MQSTKRGNKSKRLCGFGARTRILNDLKLARLPQTSGRRLEDSLSSFSYCSIPSEHLATFLHRVLNPQNLASYLFKHHQAEVVVMAKHHPDLIMCRKQPGIAIGRLCEKCDGKCVICDSYVRPCTLVRVCDECNYGSFQGRCVICGGVGISDAYYCKECTQQEKDRDGCPKIVNLGSAKTDLFYERKKYGFKKR
ncbi:unnamed protein product [Lactuca saligna]|uniref:PHD finger-like domain-containing protein 5A n=1 Tax=Lactuca saligna TaxID=75948 RepID=A0AA35VXD4_LACSI|nr:unnamed protein product [Lactuca saligna]